ncbi:unnamed protein product [Linum tenue]|uniref:Uncharacterized protein n=1 Tax=Linum tenue TaxID=586396 RepID=A0AAV0MA11_9ROSI|nr:unnamed protein product [Linum tenue]
MRFGGWGTGKWWYKSILLLQFD